MAVVRIINLREFVAEYATTELPVFQAAFEAPLILHEQGYGAAVSETGRQTISHDRAAAVAAATGETVSRVDGIVVPLTGVDGESVTLGRGRDVDLQLKFDRVSRTHAVLFRDPVHHRYAVTDSGSTNGTRVNGRPLALDERCELADGDEIDLGGLLKLHFFTAEGLHRYLPVLKRRLEQE